MQFFHLAPCPTARAAGPMLIRLITESERIPRMQIETALEDGKRMFAPSIEGYLREKASPSVFIILINGSGSYSFQSGRLVLSELA